jgi:hypothetical protein
MSEAVCKKWMRTVRKRIEDHEEAILTAEQQGCDMYIEAVCFYY